MQIPGGNHTHGRAVNTRRFCAANMIFPQDACGVWTPIPRKLNEDSVKVVFGVGFALLLPVFFGLDGVLYSMPVSDILTFLISAVIIVKTYQELKQEVRS